MKGNFIYQTKVDATKSDRTIRSFIVYSVVVEPSEYVKSSNIRSIMGIYDLSTKIPLLPSNFCILQ